MIIKINHIDMRQNYVRPDLIVNQIKSEEGFAQSGTIKSKILTDWTIEDVEW